MRKMILLSSGVLGVALSLSSCVTDPYYYGPGGSQVGASYSSYSGYGSGYGYGNPGFSTTFFVSTGNPRWGYDPYCYSYYDYHRRCYYDPYLYGYYPVGYRPPVVVGCPHPYGWRPGRSYCPPPTQVRNVTVVNYRNREASYRNLNHSWARNVREDFGRQSDRNYDRSRENSGNFRPSPDHWRSDGARNSNTYRRDRQATLPQSFNQPVTLSDNRTPSGIRTTNGLGRTRDFTQPPRGGLEGISNNGNRNSGTEIKRPGKYDFPNNRAERPTSRETIRSAPPSSGPPPRSEGKRDKKDDFWRR